MATQNQLNSQASPTPAATPSSSSAVWILQRISVAEALKPGQPLDKFAKALMVQLWQQTLDEIGEVRFDEAYRLALNASVFRPDIAEIRRFAGLSTEVPVEREAKDALAQFIAAIRKHGRRMKPVLGEILNDGKDENGRVLQVPKRAPSTAPPVFPDLVMATVVDLGFGSIMAGFEVLWSHPALDHVRKPEELDQMESFRAVAGEKIERRWVEAYTRRKAEGLKRQAAVEA